MAVDFFQLQDHARRQTGRLVGLFALAILGLVLSLYFLCTLVIVFADDAHRVTMSRIWNPPLLLGVAVATLLVVGVGSLYRMIQLRSGGAAVALMLGGRGLQNPTRTHAERRLLNVVEEMALASGVPVPLVYVLDKEPGINAFAAGNSPADAVVAVSRGCLECLNRDELQGVVAHEFSHILNGDMRLNLRLIGLVYGILGLALIGQGLVRLFLNTDSNSSSSSSRKKNDLTWLLVLGAGLWLLGSVGALFGRLIKAAVSRQREFLADASAVQFTRNPDGIAGALAKIGGLQEGSRIAHANAGEVSHMFFSDALRHSFSELLATHPPLDERIRRLNPQFDGRYPAVAPLADRPDAPTAAAPSAPAELPDDAPLVAELAPAAVSPAQPIHADEILPQVGTLTAAQITAAVECRDRIPAPLLEAAREPYSARAVLCALLRSADPQVRARQVALLRTHVEASLVALTERLATTIDPLEAPARLTLVSLATAALKMLSPPQYRQFRDTLEALMNVDQCLDLFEYALRTMVFSELDIVFGLRRAPGVRFRRLAQVPGPLAIVLSSLAHAGQETSAAAGAAFTAAVAHWRLPLALLPRSECSMERLDDALQVLAQTSPTVKRSVLNACILCTATDGQVTAREAELLRALGGALGCPIAPLAS